MAKIILEAGQRADLIFGSAGTVGPTIDLTTQGSVILNIPDASSTARGLLSIGGQTIAGVKTFSGQIQAVAGIRTNASVEQSNLNVPNGNSSSVSTDTSYLFESATTVGYRLGVRGGFSSVLSSGISYGSVIIGANPITESATGTHALLANVVIKPLAITDGVGTTTNAATLYIEGAASGITPTNANYSIWSKTGLNRFGGNIYIDQNSALALFNTSTQLTNTEYISFSWSSNVGRIGTTRQGTGTARTLRLFADSRSLDISAVNETGGKFLFTHGGGDGLAGSLGLTTTYQLSAASGVQSMVAILPNIAQTTTAGYRGLWIAANESTVGSGSKLLIDAGTSTGTSGTGTYTTKFYVTSSANVGVNVSSGTNNASAIVQIDSTTQGFLLPRMTEAQKNAISSPTAGLLIFQTDGTSPGWYGYNGTSWVLIT